ncbi:exodeoxyribonuclease VII small subunit, partial [Duncaniella muris]|uniref:exodeoxyribonuclease VII small subunit n=1 Tax=Duncaniella muris TaxID=2094150 RepID=UPI0025B79475
MPESKPVGSMTYAESLSELEAILRTMQSDSCDIDRLAAYTRRATELLKACRSRLTATEEELQAILSTQKPVKP